MSAARRTPLIAAIPKMLFPALVIVPGMIAISLHHSSPEGFLPKAADGSIDYNMATPLMLMHYFPSGMLGLGLTALMASFMSGMAGNVTAFNTVWTYDIYQSYIRPGQSDRHYLWMGHCATVGGILLSIGAAYAATKFNNIMDMLQLLRPAEQMHPAYRLHCFPRSGPAAGGIVQPRLAVATRRSPRHGGRVLR
jgi:SSS family solute:Na+ symporter